MTNLSHALWAQRASVSKMTLLAYLRDPNTISPEKRIAIERAAIELGISADLVRVDAKPSQFSAPRKSKQAGGLRSDGADPNRPAT
jgi:DNA-binding LacI/PurR family transcriptional regulator